MCEHTQNYTDFLDTKSIDQQSIVQLNDPIEDTPGSWKAKIIRAYYPIAPQERIKIVGIKCVLRKNNIDIELQDLALKRELAVWCRLNNSNVLSLMGTVSLTSASSFGHCLLPSAVFDFCEHRDTLQYINADPKPSALDRLELLQGAATGLSYIHSIKIIHGDIKGANILVDQNRQARLCDFGSAYISGCSERGCIAGPPEDFSSLTTHRYLSPEMFSIDDPPTTWQSDIWALGCVLLEGSIPVEKHVQTGTLPYEADNEVAARLKQAKGKRPARSSAFSQDQISEAVGRIAFKCWAKSPAARPNAAAVLRELDLVGVPGR